MNEDNWQDLAHIQLLTLGALEIYETDCAKAFEILGKLEDRRPFESLEIIGEALFTISEKIKHCIDSESKKA